MNATELARRLKMNTKELLAKLPELGFDIGKRAIKVDDKLVDKIIMAVEEDRRQKKIEQKEKQVKEVKLHDKDAQADEPNKMEIKIPEVVVVKDLAEKLSLPVTKVIAELMKNGIMSSLNERIDFETASIIGEDLGFKISKLNAEETAAQAQIVQDVKLKEILNNESQNNLVSRPPVVIVMGHVDHGKTKLLDAIRETNMVDKESGGITQHIGAYQVEKENKKITFLDTPGHEAFKSMRARGSKIADVAIIVVAADEGLKPQTLEVIDLVQKENLPFVIAINKIDKEGADIDRVKKELSEINIIPEDWGGKAICVPISAKQKLNIPELLDTVLLVADMEEFKANPKRDAVGTIIESHIDKAEGPVATILIQSGTLRIGDMIVTGQTAGKIKAMRNYLNQDLKEAGPSTPVKILGLKHSPEVGDIVEVTKDRKKIKLIVKQNNYQKSMPAPKLDQPDQGEEDEERAEIPALNITLKTDVLGSQEALLETFEKFKDPEVKLNVIKKGLGNITDVDVLDSQTAKGIILAFRVKTVASAEELARDTKVPILYFDIIYKLLEEVEERLKKLLSPQIVRTELGKILVLAIFKTNKDGMILGGRVMEGRVKNQTKIKVIRNGAIVTRGDLIGLQSGKEEVTEVLQGQECGLRFKGRGVIEVNDTLEIYEEKMQTKKFGAKD
ncbi:TPA: translation initiation factor IF-2 [Candidatus Komeilibacteria bacterium]|nr:MAG: Translation initiation factor IF-2 [Parcubacteria group bacterium GW2011_GWF2_45_11]KKT96110.1 MAG: Translation initiation factor IF-2 [Parcubacteria group bacterium GW2011_GWC2_45_15]OGY94483.1 MAG: translation initiation factor IF-2 [Candidatus Komeilibacteria bacterium RIFOXYC2_FULL_45_12]HAH04327.1 translation initiation factor IF-2 [Candidatus Komeilibacteria bacterium]HCC73499.1 translation initiation factor IF-2 [Candidatus Komeilibacteria bacterium]